MWAARPTALDDEDPHAAGHRERRAAQIMEAMFGPGGKVSFWMVPADKNHVVLGYVKKRERGPGRQGHQAGQAGSEQRRERGQDRGLVASERASVASFLSPAGTLKFVLRMLPAVLPPQIPVPQNLPDFPPRRRWASA